MLGFGVSLARRTRPKPRSMRSRGVADVRSTVDRNEIELHAGLKCDWWNANGRMKALHALNKLRVPLIRNGVSEMTENLDAYVDTPKPLKDAKILEVGCGGGILTEEFCQDHIEEFDCVVASEVLEHVNDKNLFIDSCVKALRPGGSFFVTTINKTLSSRLGAIYIAEYVLNLVPHGTHNWEKFISPMDLSRILDKHNCKVKLIHGMYYFVLCNQWYWSSNTDINYAIHFVKKE